jgi:hypothetical protein
MAMRSPIQIRKGRRRWIAAALAAACLCAPTAGARPASGEPGVTPPAAPVQEVEVVTSDGFDWADAGVGAGTAAGLVLLAAATATGLAHRRRLASS